MKNFKIFYLLIASFLLCNFSAFSQKSEDTTNILLEKEKKNPTKPHAPSLYSGITCFYTNESLVFNFESPEGECYMTVTDLTSGITSTYSFNSDEGFATIYVGPLTEAYIYIETSYGNLYTGNLSI